MAHDEPLTVALISLGCPKNLVDSERLLARLAEGGCIVNAPVDDADVIVVNTCGFLAAARDESLAVIREALGHKQTGRTRRVVVAGCLPVRDGKGLYDAAPGIDAVVGVHDRDDILAAVTGSGRFTRLSACDGRVASDAGRFRLTPRHTAYLRIAEGCSRDCTFCTIPSIRGPYRSKPLQAVLDEARELAEDGALELNLIAQDTTLWGRDLAGELRLEDLLRHLDAPDDLPSVRLLYAYPHFRSFTPRLIECFRTFEGLLPYVDIPLQHISDRVLRRMRRGVTQHRIRRLIETLRDRVPHIYLRTTFLVGFPGERERDFLELLDFVREVGFDALGVFGFSPEPGTPAAAMDEQVPPEVRARRAEAIMFAQQEIAFAANEAAAGEDAEVLVDGTDPDGRCIGRHAGQAPDIDSVCILTEPRPAGSFVAGTVVGTRGYDLIVEPADARVPRGGGRPPILRQ